MLKKIIIIFFLLSSFVYTIGQELDPIRQIKQLTINPPVTKFLIIGNKTFTGSKLKSLTKLGDRSLFSFPQFTEEELEKDIRRIKSFYQSNGFYFVSVEQMVSFGFRKTSAEIILHVNEGVRTRISDIKIVGVCNFKIFEIESNINSKPNTYFNPFQVYEDRNKIFMFYNNHGFIYVRVKHFLKFNDDKTEVEITFLVEERQIVYVNKIFIKGLNLTKEKIVKREIEIEEGDILLWHKLIETQKNINNLGIFTDVRFEPAMLDESKNRVDLILDLKEQKPRSFGFSVGYGSIDRERISVEWTHENLFGENQRFNISGTFKSWEDLYQANFINPSIFDTKNSMITSASYRRTIREHYKVGEISVSADLRRKLIRDLTGSAKYKLQKTDLFAIESEASEQLQIEKKVSYTPSFIYTLIYDTRDSLFYTHKGILQTISYQYAGGFLGGDNSFKRYMYNSSLFFDVWRDFILGYRVQTGFIREFGKTEFVPIEEKFHTGGINSIRGYGEKEVGSEDGGDVLFVSNLEFRFPIYQKIAGVIFYDGGQIYNKWSEIKSTTLRYSRGIGLRYHTIIVPFRIDYGEKIDRRPGEERGQFYVSIGQAF